MIGTKTSRKLSKILLAIIHKDVLQFMDKFQLFASPWWVNLIIFIPFTAYFYWRKKLVISNKLLWITGLLAAAFGFNEAATVVYIRASTGLLSASDAFHQADVLAKLSAFLLRTEIFRETATMVMLIAIALLVVKTKRERWAIFFWIFAIWDIFYYVGLWIFLGWPSSLTTTDVLFLIPVPWYAQVWFPLLASSLFILSVILARKNQPVEVPSQQH